MQLGLPLTIGRKIGMEGVHHIMPPRPLCQFVFEIAVISPPGETTNPKEPDEWQWTGQRVCATNRHPRETGSLHTFPEMPGIRQCTAE